MCLASIIRFPKPIGPFRQCGEKMLKVLGYGLRENGYEEWHAAMHEREIDERCHGLLYQLFDNLINNSIKFARPGIPPCILISGVAYGNAAQITLSDNGIGFEEHHATRIFETFTRLNPKDEFEGTGLGLSLCKKIVERHGGTISATGIPGIGATFTITLPLQQKEIDI
jgi:signal transduction histidine kinase